MAKKGKILLIDDDADFVAATRAVLESQSYEVIAAPDALAGLQKARQENPDLVLLDVIMPGENGFTAAEQFKHDRQLGKIPVIMLTSFAAKGAGTAIPRKSGMSLEAEDYLEKPVSPNVLISKVGEFLGKPKA